LSTLKTTLFSGGESDSFTAEDFFAGNQALYTGADFIF
jgi:hypothetical protein